MTAQLSRGHLEALLIASLVVRPDERAALYAGVERDRLSPAARTVAERLLVEGDPLTLRTKSQQELAERVDAITVRELCVYSIETVLILVNDLPLPAPRSHAWERDLARGTSAEDAA